MPQSSDGESISTVDTTQNTQVVENTAAESTPSQPEGDKQETMLSTVLGVLKGSTEEPPASDGSGNKPEGDASAEAKPEEPLGEFTEEELKGLGARAQRRIRDLAAKVKASNEQFETVRPKVETFDKILNFVESRGLSTQEVDFTFAVMGAMKTNPAAAYEALKPVMAQLEARIGVQLPEDLANDVRLGLITEERARELSQTRAAAKLNGERAETVTRQTQEQAEEQARNQFIGGVHSAVATWEQTQKARDPDWNQKSDLIAEKMELAFLKNGVNVKTPQDAVAIANQVLADVNKILARAKPAPKEIIPVTAGRSSPRSTPAPQTMLDVVKMNMGSGA